MNTCKANVPAQMNRPAHRCKFPAQDNGYCKRHDPEQRLATLKRQEEALKKKLAALQDEINQAYDPGI